MPGEHTFRELMSQPEAWTKALHVLENNVADLKGFQLQNFDEVIFTGCGSTYYLALAAASLLQELTGVYARGLPASEIWLYPEGAYTPQRKTLLVAVSRSGTTTETVRAVESFKAQADGQVLTFTCYPQSDLAQLGDLNVVLEAGQEESVAQTRAFSVLYLATVFASQVWSGQSVNDLTRLSTVAERLLADHSGLAENLGRSTQLDRFYFLGSGPRYGLACELSLKMKEMSLSHSEPFHFMEFRHGPQSMVSDSTLIVGLLSETNRDRENAVLLEMKERGAQVLSLAEGEADISFASGLAEPWRNVLYLPVLQRLAFERSLSKGLNPDRPHNLESVVKLD